MGILSIIDLIQCRIPYTTDRVKYVGACTSIL